MQVKQVRTRHGTRDWFKMGKGVHQGCMLSLCLFNLYAGDIMRNSGLDEAQAGIKITGRNINNLRYVDNATLMAESSGNKEPLDEMKEEGEKPGLKVNIQKTKIMASVPSLHGKLRNNGNSDRLLFWAPKSLQMVTAAMKLKGDCFLEEKL